MSSYLSHVWDITCIQATPTPEAGTQQAEDLLLKI